MHQLLRRGVNDVNRVHGFLSATYFSDQPQGLLDAPVRWDADEFGGHDSAGRLRRILKELPERGAGRLAHSRQQARPLFARNLPEQIRLLVGGHCLDERPDLARLDQLDDRTAMASQLRLVEHLDREVERKCRHHLRCGFGWQLPQSLGYIRSA